MSLASQVVTILPTPASRASWVAHTPTGVAAPVISKLVHTSQPASQVFRPQSSAPSGSRMRPESKSAE
jgi:hypothetical protein